MKLHKLLIPVVFSISSSTWANVTEQQTLPELDQETLKKLEEINALAEKLEKEETQKREALFQARNQKDPELLNDIMQNMVLVRSGQFEMGSDADNARDGESPAHTVTLSSFYIGRYEVTQALYQQVMQTEIKSYFSGNQLPINNITWEDANAFCEVLTLKTGRTFRLPTEAEWEYAAKGGHASKGFLYSGSNDINDIGWYNKNSQHQAHEVGLKAPNELGLYDMTGNVGEYVLDRYDPQRYQVASLDGLVENPLVDKPVKRAQNTIVVRGAGFDYSADESESFRREFLSDNATFSDVGFRLVMEVAPPELKAE